MTKATLTQAALGARARRGFGEREEARAAAEANERRRKASGRAPRDVVSPTYRPARAQLGVRR